MTTATAWLNDVIPPAVSTSATEELKSRKGQWVCWRYEERNGKRTKPPMRPSGAGYADSSDPSTWGDFDEAVANWKQRNYAGVGFELANGVAGIDLDNCRDKETGEIRPEAMELVRQIDSYTEVSPSLTGLKIFLKTNTPLPKGLKKKLDGWSIEMYTQERYFTVTGRHLPGTPDTINERTDVLLALYDEYGGSGESDALEVVFSQNGNSAKPDLSNLDIGTAQLALIQHGYPAGSDRSTLDQSVITSLVGAGLSDDEIRAIFQHYPIGTAGKYAEKGRHGDKYLATSIANARQFVARHTTSANGNGTGADTAVSASVLNYRAEDGGMLDAWVDEDGENWIYAAGNEQWYRWSGTHWRPDKGYALKADIQRKLDIFNQEAGELRKAAGDSDRRKMLTAYIKATKRTKARINSIEGLARNERWVDGDTLDSAALLNLKDCTLDLETFQRRPHNRADLLTYCLDYAYDPAADAPNWRYLMGCLEPEIAGFLQEFAGYVLTPETLYELSLWFYGPPGGGKSTTIHGFQTMLGPKAGLLGLADIERNRFALANIPGKTLVVSTEQPGNYLASTHVLNAIISGEPVTVDRKFRDPVDVTPRCKILWAMNDFPRVSDANNGIFRRVKVINFPAVSEEQRRPELKEAISNEGAGILNWALEGLRRLQARGRFVIPKAVEDATADFIQQNDIVGNFVEECCLTGTDYKAQSSQLYRAYKAWALETGHKPQSMTSIAGEWKRLGFEKYASNGRVYWRGVGLLAPQDDEDDEND